MKIILKLIAIILAFSAFSYHADAFSMKMSSSMLNHQNSIIETMDYHHCEGENCPHNCQNCLDFCVQHSNCFSHDHVDPLHSETKSISLVFMNQNKDFDEKISNRAKTPPEPPPPKN